jgi:putative DNA primase/helicase
LSISGEDALTVDRKNLEPVTAKLPTRLMILTNELPRLGDSSGALAGRMIVLRLKERFYGREDPGLTGRLLTELPGILLWAIEGWRRLRERGRFIQPHGADELVSELADLTSPAGAFVRECCHVGPEYEVSRSELYARYREWCEEKGQKYVEDDRGFGRNLRAAVPNLSDPQHRIDGKVARFYGGIAVKCSTL